MSSPIRRGTTIERYRVKGRLGSGSMGDVFLGVDIGLDREVALKILSERHRENRELRARFVREAKAVAAIAHPNVVQVFATGTFDGRPYIAMEFLDGTDLGSSIEEGGRWSSLRAARAVRDAAKGLHAAAEAGLIHRDVKPSNLVLLRSGVVKVTDFGLAKPMEAGDQPALTALGVVVGTPDYIAPEQARGDKIDHRVDIYALGGTLYFLLTGMPPFRTGKPHDDKYLKVVARHLKNPAPDPCLRNPSVDREVSRLTRQMMAKRADERPDYDALIERLSAICKRLEADPGQAAARGPHNTGLGGQNAPTPMVRDAGSGRPPTTLDDEDDAAPTKVHMPSQGGAALANPALQPAVSAPAAGPLSGSSVALASLAPAPRAERPAVSDSGIAPAPGVPRWVWVVTVAAILIFAIGGLLRLFGPMPSAADEGPAPTTGPASGASSESSDPSGKNAGSGDGATTDETGARAGDGVEVPEGMLLVPRADGSPWFLVDARPVSNGEYASLFPSHKASKQAGDKPITNLSYGYAHSYAEAKGKRLLSAEEWQAAAKVSGFVGSDELVEWLGAPADASGDDRPVHGKNGAGKRPGAGGKDITFRLARDL